MLLLMTHIFYRYVILTHCLTFNQWRLTNNTKKNKQHHSLNLFVYILINSHSFVLFLEAEFFIQFNNTDF